MNPSTSIKNILTNGPKPRIISSQCRICGDEAKYSYFGAIVCQPCKMFFKRNAIIGPSTFVCNFEGNCRIDKYNRHVCNACRLKKCFDCEMTSDRFRASIQTKRKRLVQTNRENQMLIPVRTMQTAKQISALNLLRADQSTLTTDQWILLSNMLNSYQEKNIVFLGQCLTDAYTSEQVQPLVCQKLIQSFLESLYEAAGTFIRYNVDLNQLQSDDRSIVLRNAVDKLSCIGGSFALFHCDLFSLKDFAKAIAGIYGETSFNMTCWTLKFFDSDLIFMKLGLVLFAVSENIVSHPEHPFTDLNDRWSVWNIQNRYAEVTWKYLLYRYNYSEAVRRFLKLTCCFIAMTVLTVHLQNVSRHTNDVESLVEQTEVTLILDEADEIMKT